MLKKLAVLLAFDFLLVLSIHNAKAEELTPKEQKLVACWQEAKATGQRFTIEEKEALVRACMAR